MKIKKYLICCHSKVEKFDGKEYCLPRETFYFNYYSPDINKDLSELVNLVTGLSFHYFDVISFVDGTPVTVHNDVSTILPF